MSTVYDVTDWSVSGTSETVHTDIGLYINSILDDIRANQSTQSDNPGAVIYIPPGDYILRTRVLIDLSYITIKGSGHGFFSSSIRYNAGDTSGWAEIWPGSSRILVDNTDGQAEAFLVYRSQAPRISSVQFRDFCLDGVSFGSDENSYTNGKVGLRFQSDTDACLIEGMGFVYLEDGIIAHNVDAMRVHNNFITECGGCLHMTGSGQATLVTANLMGAGYNKHTIFAEGHKGLLVEGNNIFPRGADSVYFLDCDQSAITGNRLHAFYPGMVVLEGSGRGNLVTANHFLREDEPFDPLKPYDNGRDDLFGLIHVAGEEHFIQGNYLRFDASPVATPTPTLILVRSGSGHTVSSNHVSCSTAGFNAVLLDASVNNVRVLLTGHSGNFTSYAPGSEYAFLGLPPLGTHRDL
ncbi:fructotransferase [Natronospirillum operosum]|uniref:Fructotransferase n=1 Tax=Natronospirillum operosum TaxID=2759953 RepID=A0A4Z0WGI5_9GAMM|nr:right-handed parallel beta-helix repeat-containing protein [Natronospirillum operosum]TGG93540.1 fructotransferase [Natronospirillum operosum]